ncbi:DUF5339 domain-containing protein [Aeromonas enteropelogenes]|uniref:DUF5339 domain-containing protein n=1 Tax=Aeromonas enteropelogenes TaxID=29489 RepID=UPI003BA1473C
MKTVILAAAFVAFSGSSFAAMTDTCKKYFDEVDAIIEQASENEAMKGQVDAMKSQMDASKKQFETLPEANQSAACEQGVAAMAQMKQALGLK